MEDAATCSTNCCTSARVPIKVTSWIEARLRPSDVPVIQGDASRIRSELGWEPQIRVEQMLSDTLEWWRADSCGAR